MPRDAAWVVRLVAFGWMLGMVGQSLSEWSRYNSGHTELWFPIVMTVLATTQVAAYTVLCFLTLPEKKQ